MAEEPTENEERAGKPGLAPVLTKQEKEFARAAIRVRMAALMLQGRSAAMGRGITDDMAAGRLGWSVAKYRRTLLNPPEMDFIADLALALDVEIMFSLRALDVREYPREGISELPVVAAA